MTNSILHYFVDTNLFIQCHPLEQLDWSPWHTFDEVRLIVSNPVLREIDRLKTTGNDRAGRRARAASAMFRQMLNETHRLIHPHSPRVVLCVEPQHILSPVLNGRLNYHERDDQLLGTVHEFARRNPSTDVRLLTHDTTPLYTARGLDLKADLIPDGWLLAPETTQTDRKLTALEAENARLKSAEPAFSLRCADQSDTKVDRYCASYTWFKPLTDAEVEVLMRRLKARFPLETDFGSSESAQRPPPPPAAGQRFPTIQAYIPPTEEEIEKYQDRAYPDWLEACEQMFRTHHGTLQQRTPVLEFTFLGENTGTRPATDVLVTIEARGGFQIKAPSPDDEDEEPEGETPGNLEARLLPRPPVAPRGHWRNTHGSQPGEALRALNRLGRAFSGLAHSGPEFRNTPLAYPSPIRPHSRDPNAFYYKPARPATPQDSFALECAQWRHDDEAEPFIGEIHVPTDEDEASGLLVCRIQAANLSNSVSSRIPVRIAIARVSAYDSAHRMVDTLSEFPDYRIGLSFRHSDTTE